MSGVPAVPHARAHVSCRTPHHARAVGYCGGGAGCYPLGERLGMRGDTTANISTALPWLTAMIVPAVCVVVLPTPRSRAWPMPRCRSDSSLRCCSSWWVCSS
ncbi:MAG: hypothetical protein ACLSVD_03320 [Eggerthellaceae bacterium]